MDLRVAILFQANESPSVDLFPLNVDLVTGPVYWLTFALKRTILKGLNPKKHRSKRSSPTAPKRERDA